MADRSEAGAIGGSAAGRILSPEEYPLARAVRGEVVHTMSFLHRADDGREC
ncbi:hypothetical protein Mnod_2353 [Methylobacterium nodulans ORS 2060]|uniref:Uncharacterized protein n=1 Tax=Methylobacterium nodulans (strain LMG 21967 / CNCM I-2342 / ORS 2060) TaxID=460265 RepID=B8IBB3_METNO|nr:hypothetical protein Mnod_2353 [Methylobacterium nodulans ORS 2060]